MAKPLKATGDTMDSSPQRDTFESMREEFGKLQGPAEITDALALYGVITGSAAVRAGATLDLYGTVTEDLIVDPGGIANVDGTVGGNVVNRGHVAVRGVVTGPLTDVDGGTSTIASDSIVSGRRR